MRDPATRGESFAASKTVGMYDAGAKASQFPTGMQQFRGTFAHELAHALIEDVKNKAGETTIQRYATATGVWTSRNVSPYEGADSDETWDNMKAAGKEPPITKYGATNAGEDLADAIKFLFEDPATLKQKCPIRYKWILQNLGPFFEQTWFSSLPGRAAVSGDAVRALAALRDVSLADLRARLGGADVQPDVRYGQMDGLEMLHAPGANPAIFFFRDDRLVVAHLPDPDLAPAAVAELVGDDPPRLRSRAGKHAGRSCGPRKASR